MSARFPRPLDAQPPPAAGASPLRAVDFLFAPPAVEPGSGHSILARAAALGIPWEQVLTEEIRAEESLRRYFEDVDSEWPLAAALQILPFTFLRSWRVRSRIQSLSAQARAARARDAQRDLRLAFERLRGRDEADRMTLAEHLWFGYQRILLLQRVSRAAAASRGTLSERLAFICTRARCSYDDAVWAAEREDSPRRGHRLDEAIRKVRDEGFQIPRAKTEARAFTMLRRIVRSASPSAGRRRPRQRSTPANAVPRRLPLPLDGN